MRWRGALRGVDSAAAHAAATVIGRFTPSTRQICCRVAPFDSAHGATRAVTTPPCHTIDGAGGVMRRALKRNRWRAAARYALCLC
jgi:hypothetical protein